ncbi:MAG: NUDIX hydrolase, partial [Myxococcaceae bacterium]|nr:NUDIX hydrolase [Myxococcaceae bacterium]
MSPSLRDLLEHHVPTDDKERADLEAMRAFAATLPSPFARDQWPAHFTGSAVVATPDSASVLLVLHAKL